ncbi:unnamed protein product [Rotaria sordida]|uniref:Uncharacterized protein n=1 Tax=Rotaria sordida TaxID=392033 RepID=A0A814GVQ6_9BILA|nr:unnamed protein product [Rotaria sordida]
MILYLQSISIDKVNEFDKFADIFDKFLVVLPNKQPLIDSRLSSLYFDDIYPGYLDDEKIKTVLEENFPSLHKRKNSYDMSFN